MYRSIVDRFEFEPGTPEDWEVFKALTWATMEGLVPDPPPISAEQLVDDRSAALARFGVEDGPALIAAVEHLSPGVSAKSLSARFGLLASWVLNRYGIEVSAEDRVKVLRQIADAALDAGWRMKRASQGDYSPDPTASRFPPVTLGAVRDGSTIGSLFDHWKAETKPAPSTLATWRTILSSFRSHAGNRGLAALTAADVRTWKDKLVASGLAAKTINDSYLACMRALFAHAVRNAMMTTNPAVGIGVKAKFEAAPPSLPYESDEVARLLELASQETLPARRWLPWLAASSGARIGEVAQLWAEHVRQHEGVWILDIKPTEDGGRVKNRPSARMVPVHPELIRQGFLEFVREVRSGPLFYGESKSGERHPAKSVANRLAEWIRTKPGFKNPRKKPSHALRHWWKSMLLGWAFQIVALIDYKATARSRTRTATGISRLICLRMMSR